MYLIGSHNSWSYLPVKGWKWKLLKFTAKCQKYDIKKQYELGVRCFDLRVRFNERTRQLQVCHNFIIFDIDRKQLDKDLEWLNEKGDVYIRVLLDVRSKKLLTEYTKQIFRSYCCRIEDTYRNIKFWCGRNLVDWEVTYKFLRPELTTDDKYASVALPKIIDDWWPWFYAWRNNSNIIIDGTDKDVLLMDFVGCYI